MMNKLFSSPKKLLMYLLLFTATIMVAGVIVVATLGFNKSYHFGGAYEVSVDCLDSEKIDHNIDVITDILDDNGCTYVDVLDKSYTTNIVVKFNANSTAKVDAIKQQLDEKLSDVQKFEVNAISNTSYSKTLKKLVVMSVVAFACVIVYGLVRRNWFFGVSLGVSFLGTMLVGLSIFAFTRIMVSPTSLYILTLFALLSAVLLLYYTSVAQARKNGVGGEKLTLKQHYANAVNSSLFALGIPSIAFTLAMIGLVFTFNGRLAMIGLSGIVAIISCVWSSIFLAGALYLLVEDANQNKIKKVMSRNNNKVKDIKKTEDGIV